VSTPLFIPPGSFAIPSVAPVYVDGVPVASGIPIAAPPFHAGPGQRFWSSAVRAIGDPHDETLVITLPAPQLVNYIALDLPHFPHTAAIFWQAPGTLAWTQVLTAAGVPLSFVITGSVPAMTGSPAAFQAQVNPYHYGAGHWVHHDESVQPFYAAVLKITATRAQSGPGGYPVTPAGRPSPYPLGARALDFGFRATQASDLPVTPRSASVLTEREPFGVVLDALGNPVQLAVRENRASDLLQGASWRSAPQPYPYSVVLLYADARDSLGSPQVIDGLALQPVTSGVRLNLYYSAQPPPAGEFAAVDTPLSFPLTIPGGQVFPQVTADGLLFADQPCWLGIDNQGVQWNPGQPWRMSLDVMPQFSSADPGSYAILDCGLFRLLWAAGAWQLAVPGAGGIALQPFAHAVNDEVCLTICWDGQNLILYSAPGGTASAPMASPGSAAVLQFGLLNSESWTGNYRLKAFVLKQEQLDFSEGIPAGVTEFAADSISYVTPALIPAEDTGTTLNALCRFCADFCLGPPADINPYGFVGGPGDVYESVSWTPVPGSFQLAAGTLSFSPVLASCLKLEFTKLAAATYNYYKPSVKTVRTVPAPVPSPARGVVVSNPVITVPAASGLTPARAQAAAQSPPAPVADPGLQVNQAVAPSYSWPDSQPLTPPSAASAGLPTEALTAPGPSAAAALAQYGSLYQMQAWQQTAGPVASFPLAGQHAYQYDEVTQVSRTGYFAGLSALSLSRQSFITENDIARYAELFLDTVYIEPASLQYGTAPPYPWAWQPSALTVPYGLNGYSQVQSLIFPSSQTVTAIQFATQQSGPVQLLADPDFLTPGLPGWAAVGDAVPPQQSQAFASVLGTMAQVARIPAQYDWALLQQNYASWQAIQSAGLTWGQLYGQQQSAGYGGIISTGAVQVTQAGQVTAAARVFSPVLLSGPLYLQIIDAASGAILAEAPQDISAGTPTEWYVSYALQPEVLTTQTWQDVETEFSTWGEIGGYWENIDDTEEPAGTTMLAQLIQYGISDDIWYTSNISLFEDSIVWEFSNDGGASWWPAYDIRNNPAGVLVFPPPSGSSMAAGRLLMWRLQGYRPGLQVSSLFIRPWYSTDPGGVPSPVPVAGGPDMNARDHYPPVADDPPWQAWSNPVPQEWWYAFRQQLALDLPAAPPPPPVPPAAAFAVSHVIVVTLAPPPEQGPGPGVVIGAETYSDEYAAPYSGYYPAPDGGDIYTDNFGTNVYWPADDPD
jgi:hypothetical protein